MSLFNRQRRFPRYACSYVIAVADHGKRIEAECRSLSLAGFGATVARDLTVGSLVSIIFKPLLMESDVSLSARVLYREGELYGFEFVAPAEQQREAIAALFKEAVGEESNRQ